MIGRRRAFTVGCMVYAGGSLTTALAPNWTALIIGWSLLEGLGAALILPAIVASWRETSPPSAARRPTG